jgi:hypothetical protein
MGRHFVTNLIGPLKIQSGALDVAAIVFGGF